MAQYSFTITPYDLGTPIDVESTFSCTYKEFKGLATEGDISNLVVEQYAEMDGARAYLPEQPRHKTVDCTLQLLFTGPQCIGNTRRLADILFGRKVEWHDTFRRRYATLVLQKYPTVVQERLYGDHPYRLVSFTFTNILGRTFDRSQIPSS